MQIDVRENRAHYAALWCASYRVLSSFIEVLITRLEKLPDDRYEPFIFDFLSEDIEQYFMVDVVKTGFDVAFQEPRHARPPGLDVL